MKYRKYYSPEGCTTCGGAGSASNQTSQQTTLNNYSNQNNQNMSSQSTNNYSQGWRGCVPPAPIVLTATVGAGITTLFMPDSTGLFASYGGTAGGQAFDVAGQATPANLSNWLFSGWFYVKAFNLQSTQTATLQNSLVLVTSQMDGSNLPQTISSSANVSNQQFNANLLNVCCGFILTNTTALRLPITAVGEVVTLTLTIGACGAYGQLPDFLNSNPILTCGIPSNCGF